MGRLVHVIPFPLSLLNKPYVEQAILNVYFERSCDDYQQVEASTENVYDWTQIECLVDTVGQSWPKFKMPPTDSVNTFTHGVNYLYNLMRNISETVEDMASRGRVPEGVAESDSSNYNAVSFEICYNWWNLVRSEKEYCTGRLGRSLFIKDESRTTVTCRRLFRSCKRRIKLSPIPNPRFHLYNLTELDQALSLTSSNCDQYDPYNCIVLWQLGFHDPQCCSNSASAVLWSMSTKQSYEGVKVGHFMASLIKPLCYQGSSYINLTPSRCQLLMRQGFLPRPCKLRVNPGNIEMKSLNVTNCQFQSESENKLQRIAPISIDKWNEIAEPKPLEEKMKFLTTESQEIVMEYVDRTTPDTVPGILKYFEAF